MANVLSDTKREQVLALGRLGWPLRRIEDETGVRRETASVYPKAAGIAVRPPGGWGRQAASKPAIQVITDSYAEKPSSGKFTGPPAQAPTSDPTPQTAPPKPANELITDSGPG